MKRSRWVLAALAAVLTITFFAPAAHAGGALSFATQPNDALRGQTITTIALDKVDGTRDGAFVQVQAGNNTRVTLTSVPAGFLSKTVRADSNGIATFDDISIATPGTYALTATANGFDSATSESFRIFDEAESCDGATDPCDPTTGALTNAGMTAKVAGTSEGGGVVGVALDIESAPVCAGDGSQYNHGPSVLTAFWDNIDGEVVITLSISKAWDQRQANNGVNFYQVCFTYDIADKTFTDRFGNTVETGLLPDCSPSQGPPCVQSRSKDKKGNVLIVIRTLQDIRCR